MTSQTRQDSEANGMIPKREGLSPAATKAVVDEVLKQATVQQAIQNIEDILAGKKSLVINSRPYLEGSGAGRIGYRHTFHLEDVHEKGPANRRGDGQGTEEAGPEEEAHKDSFKRDD